MGQDNKGNQVAIVLMAVTFWGKVQAAQSGVLLQHVPQLLRFLHSVT